MVIESSGSQNTIRLFRFMRLFGISLFSILSLSKDKISAIIAWPDSCKNGFPDPDESQEILWHIYQNEDIDDALLMGEYAYDNSLISSDKFIISKSRLQDTIGWDSVRFERAVNTLLSIRVKMIDDGEETDEFLIHF